MRATAIMIYVYGCVLWLGGAIGFIKAEGKSSVVSGILCGVALFECGRSVAAGEQGGLLAALVLSGVVSMVMAWRFSRSRQFVPSGLVGVASLVVAVWLALVLGRQ